MSRIPSAPSDRFNPFAELASSWTDAFARATRRVAPTLLRPPQTDTIVGAQGLAPLRPPHAEITTFQADAHCRGISSDRSVQNRVPRRFPVSIPLWRLGPLSPSFVYGSILEIFTKIREHAIHSNVFAGKGKMHRIFVHSAANLRPNRPILEWHFSPQRVLRARDKFPASAGGPYDRAMRFHGARYTLALVSERHGVM